MPGVLNFEGNAFPGVALSHLPAVIYVALPREAMHSGLHMQYVAGVYAR